MLGADLAVLGAGCGRAGRAGLGWAWDLAVLGGVGWVGGGVLLWWARWAGLGADLAACAWCTLYMSSSCLHDVFVFIFMCISDVLFDLIDLLALFGVYAGIIFSKVYNENTWEKKTHETMSYSWDS